MKRYVEDMPLSLEIRRQAAERGMLFEEKDAVAENAEPVRGGEPAEPAAYDDNVVFRFQFIQRRNDVPILLLMEF